MLSNLCAEGSKYFFDFFLFLDFQFPHLVIQIYDSGRLDEQSASCGGLIVDHAGYLAAVLCFNRNTVTAVREVMRASCR